MFLERACIRKSSKYIPQSALWISRLFIELANRNDKVCLTLDGRFRTEADNPDFQACYFNSANDKQVYNEFVSERIKNGTSDENFQFKVIRSKSKTNRELTFDASEKLRNLTKNDSTPNRRKKTTFGSSARRGNKTSAKESLSADEQNSGRSRKRAKPGFLLRR